MRRLVDEVEEEEYNPFRAMAHRFDILGGGDNDFLNHLLNRDGMFLPRAEWGVCAGNVYDLHRRGP